jgi:hypothetical protein
MSRSGFGLRRLLGLALSATFVSIATCREHWVPIWASMPQQVEPHNLPEAPYVSFQGEQATPLTWQPADRFMIERHQRRL